jgi:Protein of unknown function (DUF2510)
VQGPPQPGPGWYPDPEGRGLRWWDGSAWTDHYAASVQPVTQPPSSGPSSSPGGGGSKKGGGGIIRWLVGLIAAVAVIVIGLLLLPSDQRCVFETTGNRTDCDNAGAIPADEFEGSPTGLDTPDDSAIRRELVRQLEKGVLKDAKELQADGLLEGPILGAECESTGRGVGPRTDYECIAINERSGSRIEGHAYDGTVNTRSANLTWELAQ